MELEQLIVKIANSAVHHIRERVKEQGIFYLLLVKLPMFLCDTDTTIDFEVVNFL